MASRILQNCDERVDELLQAIRLGLSIEKASDYAGLSAIIVRRWIEAGREEAKRYEDDEDADESAGSLEYKFFCRYKKAVAEFDAGNTTRITKVAAAGNWQASAWLLERRNPKDWGLMRPEAEQTVKVEVLGSVPREDD